LLQVTAEGISYSTLCGHHPLWNGRRLCSCTAVLCGECYEVNRRMVIYQQNFYLRQPVVRFEEWISLPSHRCTRSLPRRTSFSCTISNEFQLTKDDLDSMDIAGLKTIRAMRAQDSLSRQSVNKGNTSQVPYCTWTSHC
jgi:hypothetical protein